MQDKAPLLAAALAALFFLSGCLSRGHDGYCTVRQGIFGAQATLGDSDGGGAEARRLCGEWAFWPSSFIDPAEAARALRVGAARELGSVSPSELTHAFVRFEYFPASWASYGRGELPAKGHATYAVRLEGLRPNTLYAFKIPGYSSAVRYYLDGTVLYERGRLSEGEGGEVADWDNDIVAFRSSLTPDATLVLHISNYSDVSPASPHAILFGEYAVVSRAHARSRVLSVLPFAAIAAMGAYFLSLVALRKAERSALWIGTLSFALALRVLCYDEFLLRDILPAVSPMLMFRLGYLTFAVGLASVAGFIGSRFPAHLDRRAVIGVEAASALYALLCLAAPVPFFTALIVPFQVVSILATVYVLYGLIRSALSRDTGSVVLLSCFASFFTLAFRDMLISNRLAEGAFLAHYGFLGVTFAMAYIVIKNMSDAFSRLETAAEGLRRANDSLGRFVPSGILRNLGKASIADICLGDSACKPMCAVRMRFTVDGDFAGPEDRLAIIELYNVVLGRINPIILNHEGFIDSYSAESMLLLLPDEASNALSCAVGIVKALQSLNRERSAESLPAISVSMGLHRGTCYFGTVGTGERMEGMALSEAVQVAGGLEEYARAKGIAVAASAEIVDYPSARVGIEAMFLGRGEIKFPSVVSSGLSFVYEVRPW